MERGPYLVGDGTSPLRELAEITSVLDRRSNDERLTYRNENAAFVAQLGVDRLLIVAGPGTGKSYLFMSRIRYWLDASADERVYVATFVRKLVKDLKADVRDQLTVEQLARVDVSTLHTLARSILERTRGTEAHRMGSMIRIVSKEWAPLVWEDVLAFHPNATAEYALDELEAQYHRDSLDESDDWIALRDSYRKLSEFYNAVGFAYLITFATEAISANPEAIHYSCWIIDEYQDFNPSEDRLIATLTAAANGVLFAGDDDQALYQDLKSASPQILTGHYAGHSHVNAMLPYCSRCSYWICRAASSFISSHRSDTSIKKIFLPLRVDEHAMPVQVVSAATPSTAVDYVRQFLVRRSEQYDAYLARRSAGDETDPFLLLLSLTGNLTLSGSSSEDLKLEELVADHAGDAGVSPCPGYLTIATYMSAAVAPSDNFAIRKVLAYESVATAEVHEMVEAAMDQGISLRSAVQRARPDVIERLEATWQLVVDGPTDSTELASKLAGLLGLQDPIEQLATALDEHPLGDHHGRVEDDEAIETAGIVAPVAKMTLVGSKGLSAHHVIVLGCDDLNMGLVTPLSFFVGMTRARESLHLVASAKTGGSSTPHKFLLDLDPECCEYINYKKSGAEFEPLDDATAIWKKFETWDFWKKRNR